MACMVFVRSSMDFCCFNSASRTCWRGVEAVEELHSLDSTTSDITSRDVDSCVDLQGFSSSSDHRKASSLTSKKVTDGCSRINFLSSFRSTPFRTLLANWSLRDPQQPSCRP